MLGIYWLFKKKLKDTSTVDKASEELQTS